MKKQPKSVVAHKHKDPEPEKKELKDLIGEHMLDAVDFSNEQVRCWVMRLPKNAEIITTIPVDCSFRGRGWARGNCLYGGVYVLDYSNSGFFYSYFMDSD